MALNDPLITIANVRNYRELHDTISATKFSGYLMEVQDEHLRQLLGDSLWYDFFIAIPDGGKYDTLLDGESYTYSSDTIYYPGLKPYVIWAWLSKYSLDGNVNHTAKGNFDYMADTATKPSKWEINQVIEGYKQNMLIERNKIIQYLNEKSSTYILWEGNNIKNTTNLNFDIL